MQNDLSSSSSRSSGETWDEPSAEASVYSDGGAGRGLKPRIKAFLLKALPAVDLVIAPLVFLSGCVLYALRRAGIERFRLGRRILAAIGVFPVRDHYYEPLTNPKHLWRDLAEERELPGIDLNESGQLEWLRQLVYGAELLAAPAEKGLSARFRLGNMAFESGDAEYWYNVVRCLKPRQIFEIGSGYSTLLATAALAKNLQEDPDYRCRHVCIEPYEQPWLEQSGPEIIRSRVELLPPEFFMQLEANDILFIDSSHVIRPQGDVLFEFLQIMPRLHSKVLVHIHDIFTPRDYPEEWIKNKVMLWNEQYLLEAFLTGNKEWQVKGALNFLHHHHYDKLKLVCPFLTGDREPGSFYIQKL